jgi:hypothetical protein
MTLRMDAIQKSTPSFFLPVALQNLFRIFHKLLYSFKQNENIIRKDF